MMRGVWRGRGRRLFVTRTNAAALAQVTGLAVAVGGCGTAMYEGKPQPEQVTIIVEGTRLVNVDSRSAPDGKAYYILPGTHAFGVDLNDDPVAGSDLRRRSSEPLEICFDAQPMRLYVIRPSYHDALWSPEVLEKQANQPVPTTPSNYRHPNCTPRAPDSPALSASTRADLQRKGASVREIEVLERELAPRSTALVVTPTETELATARERPAPATSVSHPTFELHAVTGLAFGGSRLVTAVSPTTGETVDSLNAGDGYLFGFGASFLPFWLGERLGLGAGLDMAYKFSSISGDGITASLTSLPMMATANALLRLNDAGSSHLLARGGVEKDLNVQFAATGTGGATLSSQLGYFSEFGWIVGAPNHLALGTSLRFSGVQLTTDTQHFSATNTSVVVSLYYSYGNDKKDARAR